MREWETLQSKAFGARNCMTAKTPTIGATWSRDRVRSDNREKITLILPAIEKGRTRAGTSICDAAIWASKLFGEAYSSSKPSQLEKHAHSFVLGLELGIQYTYTYVKILSAALIELEMHTSPLSQEFFLHSRYECAYVKHFFVTEFEFDTSTYT